MISGFLIKLIKKWKIRWIHGICHSTN